MIYNFSTTLYDSAVVLVDLVKEPALWQDKEESLKIKIATMQIFSALGMAFAAIWAGKVLASMVTYPITLALQIATPVILFVVLRDIFVMGQNATQHQLDQNQGGLWALFGALRNFQQDNALKFTNGTFLQPAWMWAYDNTALGG